MVGERMSGSMDLGFRAFEDGEAGPQELRDRPDPISNL